MSVLIQKKTNKTTNVKLTLAALLFFCINDAEVHGAAIHVAPGAFVDERGVIGGVGPLTINGGGEIDLNAINTFSGGLINDSSTVDIRLADNLGVDHKVTFTGVGDSILHVTESLTIDEVDTTVNKAIVNVDAGKLVTIATFSGANTVHKIGMGVGRIGPHVGHVILHEGAMDFLDLASFNGLGALTLRPNTTMKLPVGVCTTDITLG